MIEANPSDTMRDLGIIQSGATILTRPATPFDLPAEADTARAIVDDLRSAMDRVQRVHPFAKGMGIAAPQIGVGRRAAVVQPPGDNTEPIILLNPRIVAHSDDEDEQYEGCLSFFDVRGIVPRPLSLTIETTTLTGALTTTEYRNGLARLIHHELDHLDGILYTARMRPDLKPIPLSEYRHTGRAWSYQQ
ncbi:peptide deformylase [Nocardia blacklockiae]|uniref:peptide deformylase n=1 Tax=Nocardia blacklockiae TaxID=480036 RepID=UPI001893F250|nr:peptide deformylase [Nocardia blacklockiae]MBF6176000.1 peptide deformylase [Nocardia blacklockiae]